MVKKLIVILLLFSLIGCSESNDMVRYPKNIMYLDEVVSWDLVDDATSYSIKINNDVYSTEETLFSLETFPNGTYDIRVRTHKDDVSSYFSPAISITINRTYQTFDEVTLSNHILSWSEILGVSSYEIYDAMTLLATTSNASIDLTLLDLEIHELYQIRVAALYPTTDRIFSNTYIYHTYEDLDITIQTTFNHNQVEVLSICVGSQLNIDYILFENQLIDSSLYSLDEGMLNLLHDGFHPDELGLQELTILTPSGFITVIIDVVNILNPALISDDHIIYQEDMDMSFTFELNGGEFIGLSGNNITTDDYTFEDELLVIKASYIHRLLEDNPNRETVILVYQLSKGSNVIMGFIFINIPQE